VALGSANPAGTESPKGDGRWGQADLAGNAWEWTLDWNGTYTTPCTDCAALSGGLERVLRGGSAYNIAENMTTAYRFPNGPSHRYRTVGFRCARIPP
jgi:formylglycine-generating enzyme required for sulfatase activity